MNTVPPSYIQACESGLLKEKIEQARELLTACHVCPRACGVDRTENELGYCMTGRNALVSSYHAHFGEEAPLVGANGSGTIFFTYCNLLCNFCQNYEISHQGEGTQMGSGQLAAMMIRLQKEGCHNINLVTPSHVVPQILESLPEAVEQGLRIPLVYNTGAYDRVEVLKLLEGVVDIYMPDFKFMDSNIAEETCKAPDYGRIAGQAVKEMFRQVGDLVLDDAGIATRGMLVRHLVLPENLAGTYQVMKFLADEVSADTYVNIMPQYHPCGTARQTPGLNRRVTEEEYQAALEDAKKAGIHRLDQRKRVFMLW